MRWWWNALGRRVLFALRGNARLQPETRSIGADEDSRAPLSIRDPNLRLAGLFYEIRWWNIWDF